MIKLILKVFIFQLVLFSFIFAGEGEKPLKHSETEILDRPLVERYILDELKDLRASQLKLKEEVTRQITSSELSITDRALSYTTDTIGNIFYIIAVVSSLLLLVGLKSFKDIKESSELILETKILELTQNYENRLSDIEKKANHRFKLINQTQEQVERSEKISSLWKRIEIEEDSQEKLNLYDEILKLAPDDVETLVYKADTLLDLDEVRWALSLCNQAIKQDDGYAFSHWQRACANAKLKNIDSAIEDIKTALELNPGLQEELKNEDSFKVLYKNESFKKLMA